jgi:hypothetical protein
MPRFTLLVSFLFLTCLTSVGQIEINVIKNSNDSFTVSFPQNFNLDINKTYEFQFTTNLILADSVMESFTHQYIYNGLKVKKTIDHYELGFYIQPKGLVKYFGKNIFYINGTNKWKINLDGQYVSRYYPFDIRENSIIDIELQSDSFDISNAQFADKIIMYWRQNQKKFESFTLQGNKLRINLEDYKQFLQGMNKSEKYNHIVLLLPQVKVKNSNLFKEEEKY